MCVGLRTLQNLQSSAIIIKIPAILQGTLSPCPVYQTLLSDFRESGSATNSALGQIVQARPTSGRQGRVLRTVCTSHVLPHSTVWSNDILSHCLSTNTEQPS